MTPRIAPGKIRVLIAKIADGPRNFTCRALREIVVAFGLHEVDVSIASEAIRAACMNETRFARPTWLARSYRPFTGKTEALGGPPLLSIVGLIIGIALRCRVT